MAKVEITDEALEQLHGVPLGIVDRVNRGIENLARWPMVSGVKPLRHDWKGFYRLRRGDWRIIFRVKQDVVTIVRIINRKDVYED